MAYEFQKDAAQLADAVLQQIDKAYIALKGAPWATIAMALGALVLLFVVFSFGAAYFWNRQFEREQERKRQQASDTDDK